MISEVDDKGHTLLVAAALSGNKGTLDSVLAAVMEVLGQNEVRHTLGITG